MKIAILNNYDTWGGAETFIKLLMKTPEFSTAELITPKSDWEMDNYDFFFLNSIELFCLENPKFEEQILPEILSRPRLWMIHDYRPICPRTTKISPIGFCNGFPNAPCTQVCLQNEELIEKWIQFYSRGNPIVPSEWMKRALAILNPKRIHLGVEEKPKVSSSEEKRVLWIGHDGVQKGFSFYFPIFQMLARKFKDWTFTFVGRGLKFSSGNLIGLGYIDENLLDHLFKVSPIVLSSPIWDEPFGLVNLEGMSYGKIIISTRSGGIPEYLKDEENGFIVPKFELITYYKKVEEIIGRYEKEDEELYRIRGRAVLSIRKYFNHRRMASDFYSEIKRIYEESPEGKSLK